MMYRVLVNISLPLALAASLCFSSQAQTTSPAPVPQAPVQNSLKKRPAPAPNPLGAHGLVNSNEAANLYGEGLVQTVYPLSDNTALALTTYHYYTPSGRLIQRNYTGVSMYDYFFNPADRPHSDANREVKLTDSGRSVYGGGGIAPDVKIDTPKSNRFQDLLLEQFVFFRFSNHYLVNHTVTKDFQVNDAVLHDFETYLTSKQIPWTTQDINAVRDWIDMSIKSELFTSVFGQEAGLKVRAAWDPMISKAATLLPQAEALQEHAKKALAMKAHSTSASIQ